MEKVKGAFWSTLDCFGMREPLELLLETCLIFLRGVGPLFINTLSIKGPSVAPLALTHYYVIHLNVSIVDKAK